MILLGFLLTLALCTSAESAEPCKEGCLFCIFERCLLCQQGWVLTSSKGCETELLSPISDPELNIYVIEETDSLSLSLSNKVKSIHEALRLTSSLLLNENLAFLQVNILILNNNGKPVLFSPRKEGNDSADLSVVIDKKIELVIKALRCSEIASGFLKGFCYTEAEKAHVRIVNEKGNLFFGRKLAVQNVFFEAVDNIMVTVEQNLSLCDSFSKTCCVWDSIEKAYKPTEENAAYRCVGSVNIKTEEKEFKESLTNYESQLSPFGLFNTIRDEKELSPVFILENCEVSDMYFFRLRSFMKFGVKNFTVHLANTTFRRFFFLDGVLSQNVFFVINSPYLANNLDTLNISQIQSSFLLLQLRFNKGPTLNMIRIKNCAFVDGNHLKVLRKEKQVVDEGYVVHSVIPFYNLSLEITHSRFEGSSQSYFEHCGQAYSNGSLFFYIDIIHYNELNLPLDYLRRRSSVFNLKAIFIASLAIDSSVFEGNLGVTGTSLLLICEITNSNYQSFLYEKNDSLASVSSITINNTVVNENFAFFSSPSFYLQLNPLTQNNLLVLNSRFTNNKGCYLGFYNILVVNHAVSKNSQVTFKSCNFSQNFMRICSSLVIGYTEKISLSGVIFEGNGVFGSEYNDLATKIKESRYDEWMKKELFEQSSDKSFLRDAMFESAALFLERAKHLHLSECQFIGNYGTLKTSSALNLRYLNRYADIKISVIMFRGLLVANQTILFDGCLFSLNGRKMNLSEAFELSQFQKMSGSSGSYARNYYPFIGTFTDSSNVDRIQDYFVFRISDCRFEHNVFTDLHKSMNIMDIDTQVSCLQPEANKNFARNA